MAIEKMSVAKAVALARLAADIRLRLRLHQEQGLDYPLTPGLQAVLQQVSDHKKAGPQRETPPGTPHQAKANKAAAVQEEAAVLSWSALQEEIGGCTRCPLATTGQGKVLGRGAQQADLLLLGDYSDQQGNFSKNALFGQGEDLLLSKMLQAIGLAPALVYVTNVLKCCPADTAGQEANCEQCAAFLRNEISLVQPKIICVMGDLAALALLGKQAGVSRLRGHFFPYNQTSGGRAAKVLVSYHPRFLLQHESLKKVAWQDLQKIRSTLSVE